MVESEQKASAPIGGSGGFFDGWRVFPAQISRSPVDGASRTCARAPSEESYHQAKRKASKRKTMGCAVSQVPSAFVERQEGKRSCCCPIRRCKSQWSRVLQAGFDGSVLGPVQFGGQLSDIPKPLHLKVVLARTFSKRWFVLGPKFAAKGSRMGFIMSTRERCAKGA